MKIPPIDSMHFLEHNYETHNGMIMIVNVKYSI
jgi:hypothetical protein